jgi:hypothetical protein
MSSSRMKIETLERALDDLGGLGSPRGFLANKRVTATARASSNVPAQVTLEILRRWRRRRPAFCVPMPQ